MDNSVVEILDDSDVVEVTTDDKENASVNASVAVVAPDRRKATRGGVKLDDTVELLSDSEDDDQGDHQPHNKGRFTSFDTFFKLCSKNRKPQDPCLQLVNMQGKKVHYIEI